MNYHFLVGTFVWSHLKNILTSSSPTRIEIQSLLTDHNLGNKFNTDYRKFSRNYEYSFFSEEYNLGTEHQTNIIFSPKSYIPRTFSHNFTVNSFGESVNFFEITLRLEGLEYYCENLFSSSGPFNNVQLSSYLNHLLRIIRSAKKKHDEDYWELIKSFSKVIDNNFVLPRVSFSLKIFGNEIKYFMLNGQEDIYDKFSNLDPWKKMKKILSGKEKFQFEKNLMILDLSYVIPTVSGLPLRLDFSGSVACNIQFSGTVSSENLLSNGELQLNGNMTPR